MIICIVENTSGYDSFAVEESALATTGTTEVNAILDGATLCGSGGIPSGTEITVNGIVATVMSLSNYNQFFVNHLPLEEGKTPEGVTSRGEM